MCRREWLGQHSVCCRAAQAAASRPGLQWAGQPHSAGKLSSCLPTLLPWVHHVEPRVLTFQTPLSLPNLRTTQKSKYQSLIFVTSLSLKTIHNLQKLNNKCWIWSLYKFGTSLKYIRHNIKVMSFMTKQPGSVDCWLLLIRSCFWNVKLLQRSLKFHL